MTRLSILLALGIFALPLSALAQPAKIGKTEKGSTLETQNGMTLYVYDGDEANKGQRGSSCTDQCAKQWPPFLATKNDKPEKDWGIITRPDGSRQWTYKERPLYTFVRDKKAGETTGDSFNGNSWHVARP